MEPEAASRLDEVLHAKARLGIMLLLSGGPAEFKMLRDRLQLTDGNLSTHMRVLEEAGYVLVKKSFVGRRPRTVYRIAPKGKRAFQAYLEKLEAIVTQANL